MGNELEKPEINMPELNMDIIKRYICPSATDAEIYNFSQLCKAQKLNPFLKEVYLIKYGTSPATIVTGKETFMKRADRLPAYDGFRAGIIVLSGDKIVYREGSFYTSSESVLGGWAEVYVRGRAVPYRNEVSIEEYEGKKSDGTPNKMWAEKKGTMIRKVALVQSLREAFPDAFGGLYSLEEINTIESLPTYEMGKAPTVMPPTQVRMPQSKSAQTTPPPTSATETLPSNPLEPDDLISDAQGKRFYAIAKTAGWNDGPLKIWLMENFKIDSTKKINRTIYEHVCERVKEDAPHE